VGTLLASVLPLALGAAISPTLFALELLVLAGRRHRISRGWAVAGGAFAMLVVYAVLGLTVFGHFTKHHGHSITDAAIDLAAALLLALLAIRSMQRRPTAAEGHRQRSTGRMADASTLSFAGIGAGAMLLNFSTVVLFFAALHEIAHSTVTTTAKVGVGIVLMAIVLLPVLVPLFLAIGLGHRADPILSRVNEFVGRHSRQITAGIEVLFAALLIWKGIGELI